MIISLKDSFKLLGIFIICLCAVFVCTFFLNYYLDVLPLKETILEEFMPLYNAQLATAKMTCGITGGFLSIIAIIMLFFYISLYIHQHHQIIGIFKAMGYPSFKISLNFSYFGLSTFLGCASGFILGWIAMPSIYNSLTIKGMPSITPSFHFSLLFFLVLTPPIIFSLFAFLASFIFLKKPALELIKEENQDIKTPRKKLRQKNYPFIKEMRIKTLSSRKMLVFFVSFSCFCFSAMVQMGLSMEDLVSGTMGLLILVIGLILAFISMVLAMSSLIKHHAKSIALMKTMGFHQKECFQALFLGYIPFAFLGFIIGTIYQYGLLSLMVNVIFKDVGEVPAYHFNVPVLFFTFFLFTIVYAIMFAYYLHKANQVSIKTIMLES